MDYISRYTGEEIDARLQLAGDAYQKPDGGIPEEDLSTALQDKLQYGPVMNITPAGRVAADTFTIQKIIGGIVILTLINVHIGEEVTGTSKVIGTLPILKPSRPVTAVVSASTNTALKAVVKIDSDGTIRVNRAGTDEPLPLSDTTINATIFYII